MQRCHHDDKRCYTRLLGTYHAHIALDNMMRGRLLGEIAVLINGLFGGRITTGWLTSLYVARRI